MSENPSNLGNFMSADTLIGGDREHVTHSMRKPHRCGAATELCCASLVDQDDSGGEMSRPERRQQPQHSLFSQVNHNTWSWGQGVAGSNPVSPTGKTAFTQVDAVRDQPRSGQHLTNTLRD